MSTSTSKHIDPTALGQFGLAIVTLVASSNKFGFTQNTVAVLPWAIFLGGFAQIIAAIYDFKKGAVLGGTAFFSYGLFWLAVSVSWMFSSGMSGEVPFLLYDSHGLGMAFLGYLVFSVFLTVAASEAYTVLFAIFVFIDFLFVGLTLSTLGILTHQMHMLAAISELIISILAFYGAGANILNNHFGFTVLPVGKPLGLIKDKSIVAITDTNVIDNETL